MVFHHGRHGMKKSIMLLSIIIDRFLTENVYQEFYLDLYSNIVHEGDMPV